MAPSPFTLSRTARSWPSAEVTTVRVTGQMDEEAWPAFARCLEEAGAVSAGPRIAVELGPDAQLSDAVARRLLRLVADAGRSPGTGPALPLVLTGAPSAPGEAEAAPAGPGTAAELRDLRANLRTRPLIAQTQGVLQERYGLPDADTAFDLLRAGSQRHNVKLRTLASVFLSAPRPAEHSPQWFPGRTRAPAPPLAFAPWLRRSHVPRSA
ncbi:ANTAR domain-containing protein, partial [Streptomyces sp. SPB074]|uniref:ANTAR domain-containing protein n=1 Tax=Streptomyces sp. (strain SPB074) TaxID=465543 RepID=UPI0005696B14